MEYTKAFRQGEILIFELPDDVKVDRKKLKRIPDRCIREGEKSGHKHEVKGDGQLSMFGGDEKEKVITTGKKGATITHPEHKPIKLDPKKKYAVKTQKEYDPKTHSKDVKD